MNKKTTELQLLPKKNPQGGQIILEYILLMIIGLVAAVLIRNLFTGNSEDLSKSGFIRIKWIKILQEIGSDTP